MSTQEGPITLDTDDAVVYEAAFQLAEAVRQFLRRNNTQRVLMSGALDDDVVDELRRADATMTEARLRRVKNARCDHSEYDAATHSCPSCGKEMW